MAQNTASDVHKAVMRELEYREVYIGTDRNLPVSVWLNKMEDTLWAAFELGSQDKEGQLEKILQVISDGFACLEEHGIIERPEKYR